MIFNLIKLKIIDIYIATLIHSKSISLENCNLHSVLFYGFTDCFDTKPKHQIWLFTKP